MGNSGEHWETGGEQCIPCRNGGETRTPDLLRVLQVVDVVPFLPLHVVEKEGHFTLADWGTTANLRPL